MCQTMADGEVDVPGYFASVDRRTAVVLLRKSGTHRSYLIRESQSVPGSFVISFRVDPFVRHFTVVKQDGAAGGFIYAIGKRTFNTLSDVITHYHSHPLSEDLCLGDPLFIEDWPKPLSPLPRSLNGHTTTHGSRIHCYDFPSAILERRGSSMGSAKTRSGVQSPTDSAACVRQMSACSVSLSSLAVKCRSLSDTQSPPARRSAAKILSLESLPPRESAASLAADSDVLTATALQPQEREEFVSFVEEEHLEETLIFLSECDKYQRMASTLPANQESSVPILHELAVVLFARFLTPASMYEVNISVSTVKEVRKVLDRTLGSQGGAADYEMLVRIFDEAVKQAHDTLSNDVYPRFVSARSCRGDLLRSEVTAQ